MIVVGAALVRNGAVLASRRTAPPQLAGRWELPGGKVEPGESDAQALVRELHEELRCEVRVGERLGRDVEIPGLGVLHVYVCTLEEGEPALVDHDAHRWLRHHELQDVDWLAVDAPVVEELSRLLAPVD